MVFDLSRWSSPCGVMPSSYAKECCVRPCSSSSALLEFGGIGLAESMQLWERGERLAASCQRSLDGARAKVAAAWEAARSADQDESARS